jgi:hypothetical protein
VTIHSARRSVKPAELKCEDALDATRLSHQFDREEGGGGVDDVLIVALLTLPSVVSLAILYLTTASSYAAPSWSRSVLDGLGRTACDRRGERSGYSDRPDRGRSIVVVSILTRQVSHPTGTLMRGLVFRILS